MQTSLAWNEAEDESSVEDEFILTSFPFGTILAKHAAPEDRK